MNKIFNEVIDRHTMGNEQLIEHCERVGMLCYKFGKAIQLDNKDVDELYTIGLLHDIGKLLTPSDIDVSTIYPILGYNAIKLIDVNNKFEHIADIILEQGENYDGTGFPYKKTGDMLHLYSMVVHISDYYDTLRSEGKSHEETTTSIRSLTNVIFPKKIITPFIKMIITNADVKQLYNGDKNEKDN